MLEQTKLAMQTINYFYWTYNLKLTSFTFHMCQKLQDNDNYVEI